MTCSQPKVISESQHHPLNTVNTGSLKSFPWGRLEPFLNLFWRLDCCEAVIIAAVICQMAHRACGKRMYHTRANYDLSHLIQMVNDTTCPVCISRDLKEIYIGEILSWISEEFYCNVNLCIVDDLKCFIGPGAQLRIKYSPINTLRWSFKTVIFVIKSREGLHTRCKTFAPIKGTSGDL